MKGICLRFGPGVLSCVDIGVKIAHQDLHDGSLRNSLAEPKRMAPPLQGHTKVESMVRYLGIEVDDALTIAEQVDI